jgi:hypothetical protein
VNVTVSTFWIAIVRHFRKRRIVTEAAPPGSGYERFDPPWFP